MASPSASDAISPDENSSRFGRWYFGIASGALAVIGLVLLLAAFDDTKLEHERLLRLNDSILGFRIKYSLLVASLLHFVLGGLVILLRDLLVRVLLVLWACCAFALYGWGSERVASTSAIPVVTLASEKLGINPRWGGVSWSLLLAGLGSGGLVQLGVARSQAKRRQNLLFLKHWQESREREQ